MTVRCDGCEQDTELEFIHFYQDYDHNVRYCAECLIEWQSFVRAAEAQELVFQRQMDEWTLWARKRLNLKLTPLDLAMARPTARPPSTHELILA